MVIGMQWIIFIGVAVVSWLVQMNLQNKFKKYSQIPTGNGMTGADVARKMLNDNGIYDVQVTCTPGHLTDHYNPANKTVNLSESVYSSNSIMAAAVAAHECGHALQHARAYAPLTLRSKLVPVVSFASNIMTCTVGRYLVAGRQFELPAGRYHPLCDDHVVQLHHSAGGNQCQPQGVGMAQCERHHQLLQSR